MDRDRKLAEMMGIKGWYCFVCERQLLPEEVTYVERCSICNTVLHDPDFSTPEWRAKLMDWATEQEWWENFYWVMYDRSRFISIVKWERYLWRNLPSLLVEYHGEGR
ncbi:MAG TPA: hypothetical protein PKX17_04445 [Candidatus Methanomethylicus sp.]|nr:hypothetical protein [Candidatus Methanomethylicus sp.]